METPGCCSQLPGVLHENLLRRASNICSVQLSRCFQPIIYDRLPRRASFEIGTAGSFA